VLNDFEDDETHGGTEQSNIDQGRQLQNGMNSGDALCWSSSNVKGASSTSTSYIVVDLSRNPCARKMEERRREKFLENGRIW
ncbi:hypothetical protein Csa_012733, partial [Cucumis sativus]